MTSRIIMILNMILWLNNSFRMAQLVLSALGAFGPVYGSVQLLLRLLSEQQLLFIPNHRLIAAFIAGPAVNQDGNLQFPNGGQLLVGSCCSKV